MNPKKYFAEFLGTFLLVFGVSMSIVGGNMPMATPFVAALTVGLLVYTLGPVSGAHFNPAVTIALATIKKISLTDGALYLLSQFAGAVFAMLAVQGITGETPGIGATDSLNVGLAEMLGAFILVWGICSVVFGKTEKETSGAVIGLSLLLGLSLTSGLSNGVLNPAVAVALGSVSVTYMLAPVAGAVIAALGYKYLTK